MPRINFYHNNKTNGPVVLAILDGWGITKENTGNAFVLAKKPTFDNLFKKYPHAKLAASGVDVGLPAGQPGNSEAGHMNIGAGRIVEQDAVTVSRSINNGTFFKNPAFLQAIKHVNKHKSSIHLMGLLSDVSSPHSDTDHLLSLLSLFQQKTKQPIYLHLFTDGRDSPIFASAKILAHYRHIFDSERVHIATIMGRFYAMDRKKAWDRTKSAYDAMTLGKAEFFAANAEAAVSAAYARGESDEFIKPSVILNGKKPVATIGNNDSVVFFNLRSDRARQLSKVFVQTDFVKKNPGAFKPSKVLNNLVFVALTDFGPDLDSILTAYPGIDLADTLVATLKDKRQLYIAETEKYAHVTYFFNGGYDHAIVGETRINIPSQEVDSYDMAPAMSAPQISKYIVDALKNNQFDFITVNFANLDMVGHTGNLQAAIKAIEAVDSALTDILKAVFDHNGTLIVSADHGNIEEMINLKTGEIDTEHSTNPVPFIVANKNKKYKLKSNGSLSNIAPTILEIMNVDQPLAMTAKSLIIK
jgi:2,3-bisphosphoglycerate-independent phosphoglycerate mutase